MITRVKLEDRIFKIENSIIEEFELPGEYCMIPWVRIKPAYSDTFIECPIHKVTFVERI